MKNIFVVVVALAFLAVPALAFNVTLSEDVCNLATYAKLAAGEKKMLGMVACAPDATPFVQTGCACVTGSVSTITVTTFTDQRGTVLSRGTKTYNNCADMKKLGWITESSQSYFEVTCNIRPCPINWAFKFLCGKACTGVPGKWGCPGGYPKLQFDGNQCWCTKSM